MTGVSVSSAPCGLTGWTPAGDLQLCRLPRRPTTAARGAVRLAGSLTAIYAGSCSLYAGLSAPPRQVAQVLWPLLPRRSPYIAGPLRRRHPVVISERTSCGARRIAHAVSFLDFSRIHQAPILCKLHDRAHDRSLDHLQAELGSLTCATSAGQVRRWQRGPERRTATEPFAA